MNQEIFNNLSDMLNKSKNSTNAQNSRNFEFFNNKNNPFFSGNFENKNEQNSGFDFSNIDMETILKIKKIMSKMSSNQPSPRSNLLMSLKPYLKDSKKEKIDQYIQFMNMASVFEELNRKTGGDIK